MGPAAIFAVKAVSALVPAVLNFFRRPSTNYAASTLVNEAERAIRASAEAYLGGRISAEDHRNTFEAIWEQVEGRCNQLGNRACVADRQRGGKFDWFMAYLDEVLAKPYGLRTQEDQNAANAYFSGLQQQVAAQVDPAGLVTVGPVNAMGVSQFPSTATPAAAGTATWRSLGPYNREFASRFGRLESFLKSKGFTFRATSGYRSAAQQAAIPSNNPFPVARPGQSLHQAGRAIDGRWFYRGQNLAPADLALIGQLAARFGITWGGTADPVHFQA